MCGSLVCGGGSCISILGSISGCIFLGTLAVVRWEIMHHSHSLKNILVLKVEVRVYLAECFKIFPSGMFEGTVSPLDEKLANFLVTARNGARCTQSSRNW